YTDTLIGVGSYGQPPNAAQPHGGQLQTNDSSILSVAWRNNRLLATHTVGVSNVARVRWYEFNTSGTPSLKQSGTINQGSGVYTYFPSININPNGDIGLTFMQSSTSQYVSMYVTGQLNGAAAGTMQTPVLAKLGQGHYNAFDGNPYRAGDFSGTSV